MSPIGTFAVVGLLVDGAAADPDAVAEVPSSICAEGFDDPEAAGSAG